jgi:hypothetical protein
MLSSFVSGAILLIYIRYAWATFDTHLDPLHDISPLEVRKIAPGPSTSLPFPWSYQGCYTDNGNPRTLSGASYANITGMTAETCVNFCSSQYYIYAGNEYAQECCIINSELPT